MSETPYKETFKSSFLFNQYYEDLISSQDEFKGKIMKYEQTIKNVNEILKEYVKSNFDYINRFFKHKMVI